MPLTSRRSLYSDKPDAKQNTAEEILALDFVPKDFTLE
jgi:hypothetical protein